MNGLRCLTPFHQHFSYSLIRRSWHFKFEGSETNRNHRDFTSILMEFLKFIGLYFKISLLYIS
jgi:hypothetical protein